MCGLRGSIIRAVVCSGLFVGVQAGAAPAEIEVRGLFTDAALLIIDGRRQLLRVGERSEDGVLLIEASSRGGRVEIDGRQLPLVLSGRISGTFASAQATTVTINRVNDRYRTTGSINDVPVSFLVDTGASIVAISSVQAQRLGLDTRAAEAISASTASGAVTALKLNAASVQVGDIRVQNVPVAVIPGEYPTDILLGMSFLRNVEISENAGLMMLKAR